MYLTPMGKFFLVLVGLVASLCLVEIGMRLWGRWYLDTHPNHIVMTADDTHRYRIVALGESTTAPMNGPSWPELLEQELNTRVGSAKFRVYNLGVSGTNTNKIITHFMENGISLRPNMVITMMGINDQKYFSLPVIPQRGLASILRSLTSTHLYKFLIALQYIFQHRAESGLLSHAAACNGGNSMGEKEWEENALPHYNSFINSLYPAPYNGPFSNTLEDKRAEAVLVTFINTHPFSYAAYEVLADHYAARSMWQDVISLGLHARDIFPFIRLCIEANPTKSLVVKDTELRDVADIGYHVDALVSLGYKIIATKPGHDSAVFYKQIRKALGVGEEDPNIDTKKDYTKLATYLRNTNIVHVAMQYPLTPLGELQDMLVGYPQTVFVDNEANFRDALKTHSTQEVFTDNFAGIFGHTTRYGSQLIASAAAEVVLQVVAKTPLY